MLFSSSIYKLLNWILMLKLLFCFLIMMAPMLTLYQFLMIADNS